VPPEGLYGYVEPEKLKRKPVNETLTAEKHIYFSIMVISLLAPALYYMARIYFISDAFLQIPKLLYMSGILVCALIPLGFTWLALYSPFHFVKWAFIGLCSLGMLLAIVVTIIVSNRPGLWENMAYSSGGLWPTLLLVGVLVALAWTMWFVSILYRDIQFLEAN
jgi:hypothetical protein